MTTKIEWCDEVWNPVVGCTPVSAGCDHCYARRIFNRNLSYHSHKFENPTMYLNRLEKPFHWRKPRRVFVNSMSDLFHPGVSFGFIGDFFAVMTQSRRHNFMVLTKRPERMLEFLRQYYLTGAVPARNIWLGVTAENQATADERIPLLLQAPAAVRVAKLLFDRFGKEVIVSFFDPDTVEEKNIYRQNFCAAEIGCNKAETLAERFGLAWGVSVEAVGKKFTGERSNWTDFTMIAGCVDTWSSRKDIASFGKEKFLNCWWLDSGNTKNNGQILLGKLADAPKDAFALEGFCGWLPSPAQQHPELIKKTLDTENIAENELSCAEMALRDSQGLAINQRMAAEAADYLVRMLITKDLHKFATYIDLESGTAQSRYISEKAIKGYGK